MGLPADMQQAVAVSDAKSQPDHPWTYAWSNPDDRDKMKSAMEDIARTELGLSTPAPAPKPAPRRTTTAGTTAAHRAAKPAPPPPPPPDRNGGRRRPGPGLTHARPSPQACPQTHDHGWSPRAAQSRQAGTASPASP